MTLVFLPGWNSLDRVTKLRDLFEIAGIACLVCGVVFEFLGLFVEENRKIRRRLEIVGILCFAALGVSEYFQYRYSTRKDELDSLQRQKLAHEIEQRNNRIDELEGRTDTIEFISLWISFDISKSDFRIPEYHTHELTLISDGGTRYVFAGNAGVGHAEVSPGILRVDWSYVAPADLVGMPLRSLTKIKTLSTNLQSILPLVPRPNEKISARLHFVVNDTAGLEIEIPYLSAAKGEIHLDVGNYFSEIEEQYVQSLKSKLRARSRN
jgi:hypothetical protein